MVSEGKTRGNGSGVSGLKTNADLFAAFFRVGILGFGGGPSAIPLFHREAVKKYKWMTDDEFGDTLALGNTMPGPIATKMAGYIGYQVNGITGCIIALVASVVPTVIMMILLLGALQQFKELEWVNNMSAAVVPVVGVMLAVMTWDFLKKSGESLGWKRAVVLTIVFAVLLEVLHIHPAVLIVGILLIVLLPFKKGGNYVIYWSIFLAFFIPGILGYGGGPASIPLIEKEVVDRYGWMSTQEFGEVLALGNALPGPIATKMAGYIGYMEGGILGSFVALFASVAPSLFLMLILMVTLMKYKDSMQVKNITKLIRPVIAVLLGAMTLQFFLTSKEAAGSIQTIVLIVVSYWLLEIRKLHPALVIGLALAYGAISSFI